jgi:2-phosphosulfolactate phosphatase
LEDRGPEAGILFGWGLNALRQVHSIARVIVVVDIFSFTTAAGIAVERGGCVYPYPRPLTEDAEFFSALEVRGRELGALVATRRDSHLSSSPQSMQRIEPGQRVILPSLNGATLCRAAEEEVLGVIMVANLRNALVTSEYIRHLPGPVAVMAAGERWPVGH